MNKYVFQILSVLFVALFTYLSGNAWVYTTVDPHDTGWNYYYSEPIKLDGQDGKVVLKLCMAQKRSTGDLGYFILYLPEQPKYVVWETPEKAPKNYKKDFVMKIRDGAGDVFDLKATRDFTWKIEKITVKKGSTLTGKPLYDESYKIDDLVVWYRLSKDEFYKIVETGIKKIRVETTSPDRFEDYNFTDKQANSIAKNFKKHHDNMLKRVDEIEKKLVKSREANKNSKPQPKKPLGEF